MATEKPLELKRAGLAVGEVWRAATLRFPASLGFGLLLRFGLMALTGHNDALFIPWLSFPILNGDWNIYEYFAPLREAMPPGVLHEVIWAPNPPLTYYTLAGWMALLRLAGWLDVTGWDYAQGYTVWNLTNIPRMLFLTKIVYLSTDLAIWLMLRRLVEAGRHRTIDLIWLFSPITLFGTYLMGQTDILATGWVVVALLLAKQALDASSRKTLWSLLALMSLGIGAGYKMWPLMLMPLWSVFLGDKAHQRLGLLLGGLLPFALCLAPFMSSPAFRDWVFNGQGSLFLNPALSGWWVQNPSPFVIAWGGIHLYLIFFLKERTFEILWRAAFAVLLAFFTLNSFWEFYWLVWLLPFLTLALAYAPNGFWLYLYQAAHFFFYTLAYWSPGLEVLRPLAETLAQAEQTLRLKELFFPGGDGPIRRALAVSFSLFIAASWGLFALAWPSRQRQAESTLPPPTSPPGWQAALPPALLGAYLAAVVFLESRSGQIPSNTIWTSFLETLRRDAVFFAAYFALVILTLVFSLLSFIARPEAED